VGERPTGDPGRTQGRGHRRRAVQAASRIVVGKTTAGARHKGLDLDKLGAEGFVIKTIGGDLVLAGGEERGTLYAVYTFLESLGCRWWDDEASTIPKLPTIRVPATDRREGPPKLEYRDLVYREHWGARLWGVRNKAANFTGGGDVPERWGGTGVVYHSRNIAHSWVPLLKMSKDLNYEQRPELWAVRKGEPRTMWQPCTSHSEVQKAIAAGALAFLRQHPEVRLDCLWLQQAK